MTNFGLSVAAENVKVLDLWHPSGLLLLVGEVLDRHAEHSDGQADSREQALKVGVPVSKRLANECLLEESILVLGVQYIDALPEILLHLVRRHIVKLQVVPQTIIRA